MDQPVTAPATLEPAQRPSPVRIKRLGHVVIQVRNLERSVRFYTEILNFRVSDDATAGGVFLTAIGDHHTIGLFPSDGDNAEIPSKGAVKLHHFAFQVDSLDELFEIRSYLRERGVPIVWDGRRAMGGPSTCIGTANICRRSPRCWPPSARGGSSACWLSASRRCSPRWSR